MKAVLIKSKERFEAFQKTLEDNGVTCIVLDFDKQEWTSYDYSSVDFLIYYSSFEFSSNHPLALYKVYDNLTFIKSEYPHINIYPDPAIIKYYNDKYRQYLFLSKHGYPIPHTIPLFSEEALEEADVKLGYPMIIKNRYGAGGDSVFKVNNKEELYEFYRLSSLDLFNVSSVKYFTSMLKRRIFYYHLIKAKRMVYPFLSAPLLAQKFVKIDRDLKTVVGDGKVVEAHWRFQANEEQWKVNIDGGGIGVWSEVPREALDVSEKLAMELGTSWLNIDLLYTGEGFLVTEFSPVWHHYAYKEKASFVYKDDYNIEMPLEESLNLEKIIVDSLVRASSKR